MSYRVAVVGATGNVGREMLNILEELEFPIAKIHAIASRKSIGVEVAGKITETNAGALEWKLYAQKAAIFDVTNTITAYGVKVDFFDEQGHPSSQLTAREGEINQLTRDMTARGNVVLQNSDGARMSTQSMRFLNREQKIVSDELVRVEQKGNVLTGVGFEGDPDLKHYKFRTAVSGTVRSRVETLLGPEKKTP